MENIPMFTTEHGVGSLILREIPYSETAYICIASDLEPAAFLADCLAFCKTVGAKTVYATGDPILESYPFHTAVWKLVRPLEGIGETDACIIPVTQNTVEKWREIYNRRMKTVDNSAWFSWTDGKKLLREGNGYFIHRNGMLLGIGMASGGTLDAVVSEVPGAGKDVVIALCRALTEDTVTLQVASTNSRALRLYDRLGFVKAAEISTWYQVV